MLIVFPRLPEWQEGNQPRVPDTRVTSVTGSFFPDSFRESVDQLPVATEPRRARHALTNGMNGKTHCS